MLWLPRSLRVALLLLFTPILGRRPLSANSAVVIFSLEPTKPYAEGGSNISDNEGRLTPKLVADFSKDYGAQRSEQEIYSQGGKRGRQRRDRICGGEEDWQPRLPEAHTYRNRVARGRRFFMRLLDVWHGLSYGLYFCI